MATGGLIITLIGASVAIHATRQLGKIVEKGVKPQKIDKFKF